MGLLKGMAVQLLTEKFLKSVLMLAADLIVLSTKTDKDDEWLAKVKTLNEQSK